ncbi:hypothetical protein [Streptomyces seoulensis]|uniref:hypothetical protein n=1 Tax=Streptomyces seoulensis TaxID=73044 RepID=UPI001FCAAF45|nr:hypothetical protein [Streptomyces seoulensis]BDH06700.1 hypothetical protein HEK131_39270 [Streptomyces seoulensis]
MNGDIPLPENPPGETGREGEVSRPIPSVPGTWKTPGTEKAPDADKGPETEEKESASPVRDGVPDARNSATSGTQEAGGAPSGPGTPESGERPARSGTPDAPGGEPVRSPEGAPSADQDGRPAAAKADEQVSALHNTYNTTVNQNMYGGTGQGGVTGIAGFAPAPRGRATGPMRQEEIALLLRHHAEPDAFAEALAALRADHVVTLIGESGTGRRSGAVALLKKAMDGGGRVIVLSPDITLDQLAEREFHAGKGYVVLDRVQEGSLNETQADFAWRRVQERVHASRAHLVVTTRPRMERVLPTSVSHVAWSAPSTEQVLRLRLRLGGIPEETIAEAVKLIRPNCPVAKAAEVADGICEGGAPEEVWNDYDTGTYDTVQRWFLAPGRTMREVLQVTTVAFAAGSGIRSCEELFALLDAHVGRQFAQGAAGGKANAFSNSLASGATQKGNDLAAKRDGGAESALFDRRRAMLDIELLALRQVPMGAVVREVVEFATPSHRRWVFIVLCGLFDSDFWDGVRKWLGAVLSEPEAPCSPGTLAGDEFEVSLAAGLAMLATKDFEEVVGKYLVPWAQGHAGQRGQSMAVYVLWYMCQSDLGLDTVALDIARGWARSTSPELRGTAALAFSGWLGVRFPSDAVKWLWHLIANEKGQGLAAAALANHFALLVHHDEDTSRVLGLLTYRLDRLPARAGRSPMRSLTYQVVVTILAIRDASGRPVALRRFVLHPEGGGALLDLWAKAFCYRPLRAMALKAFADHLGALPSLTESTVDMGRALGRGLGERVTDPTERRALCAELKRLTRNKKPQDAIRALLDELCCDEGC